MSKATTDELGALHAAIAKQLREKIESGDASASDLAVAVRFLKDNGIEADLVPGGDLDRLRQDLPKFDSEMQH